MSLIEQAVKAEQEYRSRMKEATDRLRNIQSYLGLIYIQEEIVGVESISVKDDMVHLDVRCSFEAYGMYDDSVLSCDIPLEIFNATDKELNAYRAMSVLDELPEAREDYQRNLSIIHRSKMDIEYAEKTNKRLVEKYGDIVK